MSFVASLCRWRYFQHKGIKKWYNLGEVIPVSHFMMLGVNLNLFLRKITIMMKNTKNDTGMKCVITVANYHGIGVDEEHLRHLFVLQDKNIEDDDILRIARHLKLKAKAVRTTAEALEKLPLPAILRQKDGTYALLARFEGGKCLLLNAGTQQPFVLEKEELDQVWEGTVILCSPRAFENKNLKFGIRWFMPTVLKFKKPLLEVLMAAFVMQILAVVSPLITQSVIDKVLVHGSLSTLDVLAAGLVLITIFETLLSLSRNYVFAHTTSRIDVILSCRLFRHLFHLPLSYFEAHRIGDTIARVKELETIRRFLTGLPMSAMLDTLFIIVYLVFMFFYSTKLTLITLASLPVLVLVSVVSTPVLKGHIDDKFHCGAESQSYLVEAVTGIQTIKSYAIEPFAQKKWEGLLANYTKAGFKMTMAGNTAGAAAQLIQKLFDIAILYYGALLVIGEAMTTGQLVAFRMLAGRVSQPVLRIVQTWQEFQQVSVSIQRLGDIFRTRPEPSMEGNQRRLPALKGNIEFENVRFRYKAEQSEVIRDMTFRIPAGRTVGIVGRSGSGKSTLSKLIQRMYIPESGKIRVDGLDISTTDPVWLRHQIGIVLQENFMFHATVRENIALQNPAASMDEIIHAAKMAGAHEFITELSEGYDTMLGEKGTGLSGGQKQRVAIARALLTNPRILIFDEATSALDYESERIIQDNLRQMCAGRTVLIIAHRLSTLKEADGIMVIERGKIVEYGAAKELIRRKGVYYHMLKRQGMTGHDTE